MTPGDSTSASTRPLLDWLLARYPDTPKKRAKQWITAGRVSVNGVILRQPNQPIPDPKDALELLDRHAIALDCGRDGWQIHPRVAILYLDSALAVVNKGPGLLSVPAEPDDLSALSILDDFLAGKLRAYDRGVDGRGYSLPPAYRRLKPLPVHRLDQYTSGVFCMAMNPAARQNLIDQLKVHTMRREYVAYVEGRPPKPQGTWRNWLKLSDDQLRQFIVSERDAKASPDETQEAITHYEVIAEFSSAGNRHPITKLRLRLETGRKHQIRAQAAHAGLPLVGDRTYHPRYQSDAPKSARIDFPRQALHAEVLGLDHPDKPATRMTWTAALPKDLRQLEAKLREERT
ncbi:MAG TPA: RluA family pseudouridine synthase [Verrucomicrobiae bacterium]|nr:RluA family pseudouridine synthase [Verrucomicrobiae bacterium]